MTTSLHNTLAEHRMAPRARVWPSMVATATFVAILFVTWVYGIVLTSVGTRGEATLADTAYGQPLFVRGAIVVAFLLLGLVVHDVVRHRGRVWRYSRFAIGAAELALIAATLVLLFRAGAIL